MNNLYVTPRDGGKIIPFDLNRITHAVNKAIEASGVETRKYLANDVARDVRDCFKNCPIPVSVNQIENKVVDVLNDYNPTIAKTYEKYMKCHQEIRELNMLDEEFTTLRKNQNDFLKGENANKDTRIIATKDSYYSGILKKDYARRNLYSAMSIAAHDAGLIHIHDITDPDRFNCVIVNLGRMLREGTVISGVGIDPPKTLRVAANVAMQIITQVSCNQYGGITFYLSDLAPFVDKSRKKHRKDIRKEFHKLGIEATEKQVKKLAELRLKEEIKNAVQTIQYELVTEQTTAGQTPFVSMSINTHRTQSKQEKKDLMLLAEEVFKQRAEGIKNAYGVKSYPTFPKLLFFLNDENMDENNPEHELFEKAVECTAKTMNPDYLSADRMTAVKGTEVDPMGCRSEQSIMYVSEELEQTPRFKKLMSALEDGCFIREDRALCDPTGEPLIKGRPNMGVVTLNLAYVALIYKEMSERNNYERGSEYFYQILDQCADLVRNAQLERLEQLKTLTSDNAPILFQHGAYVRLEPGESLEPLLYDGYSSISFGYAGLAECVTAITGKDYLDPDCQTLAVEILEHMNALCDKWKEQDNLGWGIYGTPMESTIGKFADRIRERFGSIKGVTDKGYISNSYHVPVEVEVDAFTKLEKESKFQELSAGGSISYVEIPSMIDNLPALESLISYIGKTNMYAEVNTKIDTCNTCGYHGEMDVVEEGDLMLYQCPNCGEKDPDRLDIIRRMCGYLGKYERGWNKGRFKEIANRVLHL